MHAQAERVAHDPNLDITVDRLKRMCRDKPEALDALGQATANPVGANQYREGVDNIHTLKNQDRPTGTSAEAALRRLRDQVPVLHARVLADDLSQHAAMVEAALTAHFVRGDPTSVHIWYTLPPETGTATSRRWPFPLIP